MAKAKTLVGARAKIQITKNVGGKPSSHTVGLFSNCSWSIRQAKEPLFVLGRYSPAEIVGTSQEAVSLSLSGYRVVDAGPYAVANATLLKDLLEEEDFTVEVLDRANNNKVIFRAVGCKVTSWSSGVASRGVSDIRIEIVALKGEDETGIAGGGDDESATAAKITDGI
jgi:hypothetical protein